MQTRVFALNYIGDYFLSSDGTIYEAEYLGDLVPAYLNVRNSIKSRRVPGALVADSPSQACNLLHVRGDRVTIPSLGLDALVRPELHTEKPTGGFYFPKELLERYIGGANSSWDRQPWAFFPEEKFDVLRPYIVRAWFKDLEKEEEWFLKRLEANLDFRLDGIPIEPSISLARKLYRNYALQLIMDVAATEIRLELRKNEALLEEKLRDKEQLSQELASLESKLGELRGELASLGAHKETLAKEITTLETQHESLRERVAVLSAQARALEKEALRDTPEENLLTLPIYDSEGEALLAVRKAFEEIGRKVDPSEILALHVAVKLFPFTVLAGESGTGKSSLLIGYARAMGMRVTCIPVQPTWSSVADFHGFINPITGQFVSTPFSEVLELQVSTQVNLEGLVDLVLLDEINLAYVEYFLADYLSALEGDRRVRAAWVPRNGFSRSQGSVIIPPTLLFTGTANEDHTTRSFSDKFRDRAAFFYLDPSVSSSLTGKVADSNQIKAKKRVSRVHWNEWRETISVDAHSSDVKPMLAKLEEVRKAFVKGRLPLSERLWQGAARFLLHATSIGKKLGNEYFDPNTLLDFAVAIRPAQKYGAYLQAHIHRHEAREKAQHLKSYLEEQGLTRAAARFDLE